jgi:hypothetical protein
VHLVGSFPELEDELCTFTAGSPDRLDAMVWALTELMVENAPCTGFLEYYRVLAEQAKATKTTVAMRTIASGCVEAT